MIAANAAVGKGGAVGGVVTKKARARWKKTMIIGAVTGVALAIVYYVGLDWIVKATGMNTLASAGEFVAFALGFIGAIVSVKWIGAPA